MTRLVVMPEDEIEALIERAVAKVLGGTKPTEAMLPVHEVAKRLGKSKKTIRNWIHDGRFTSYSGGDGSPYLISSLEVAELSRSANSCGDVS